LQGSALLSAMKSSARPTVVMIHGDPTDLSAQVLKKAAHGALDGKVTVAKEYDTPSSSAGGAQEEMTQALAALDNKVDGVYAADARDHGDRGRVLEPGAALHARLRPGVQSGGPLLNADDLRIVRTIRPWPEPDAWFVRTIREERPAGPGLGIHRPG